MLFNKKSRYRIKSENIKRLIYNIIEIYNIIAVLEITATHNKIVVHNRILLHILYQLRKLRPDLKTNKYQYIIFQNFQNSFIILLALS